MTGIAKDVEGAVLEKLGATGNWAPSAKVAPADDGSFAITVRPKVTATYRLSADGAARARLSRSPFRPGARK